MIALQEELDWQVFSLYGLLAEDLRASEDPDSPEIPELAPGERAFEIVLARRVAAGEATGEWFKRHGSTPITEIPAHWPVAYREVVQRRIDAIESSRAIGMVERPEYKRRWATEGWDALQQKALHSWLLDRLENREYWFDDNDMPTLVTLSRLTDALSRDDDFVSVAKLYEPHKELHTVVAELMTGEHVPFLAALRYKPSGLKKRADWEHVGSPAAGRRGPGRAGQAEDPGHHPRTAEVHLRRLPAALLLEGTRQTRRTQGAVHLLWAEQCGHA